MSAKRLIPLRRSRSCGARSGCGLCYSRRLAGSRKRLSKDAVNRPAKLSYAAMRVMRAVHSDLLSFGLKMLALELYGLDNGPDGAWMGANDLAQRLGVQPDTVEKGRRQLVERGLLEKLPAPVGAMAGWVVAMPAG